MTTTEGVEAAPLVDAYEAARAETDRRSSPLSAEDQTVQSMPDVSPTKWHRAHTSWFFETFLLEPHLQGYRVFEDTYAYLFNSYYEAVGPRHPRPERGLVTRPGIDEIARYRTHVDAAMVDLLASTALDERAAWLVELGINHEQQHQELLFMDIKHVLSLNPLKPVYDERIGVHPRAPDGPPTAGWLVHEGGFADIGHDGAGFAFDNESPRHRVYLAPFALSPRPVNCGEWLAFIGDGGYERPELWLAEGWGMVQTEGWRAPLYWSESGDRWEVFTMRGQRPIAVDEPVCHVSYFEADAFARWSDGRLPTEFEWEAMRPSGAGEVWEWTASAYAAYPGFRTAPGAVGEYNGKFMVNQYVLRGGCCATPAGHARPTYRNFFPAYARWAFSGVRIAKDAPR